MFSPVYTERVLEPAYQNWKTKYAIDAVAVHKAHLLGLVERGIIPKETGKTIAGAIARMEADFTYPESIPPSVEDLYFVYERELGSRIGAENAAFLHTARSRNDMDNTIFRMALRRTMLDFSEALLGVLDSLVTRARAGQRELTILYTHGQPANVSTMAHYLSAFAGELASDLAAFMDAFDVVNLSTMGACAITGTGFPLDRSRVASLLGFPSLVVNTYEAISSTHWLTRPAVAMEELLQDLTRLMADMSHKASCEVGLLTFPDSLVQTSSIMPQKRNPVILEHVRIQAGLAAGTCLSIRNLCRNAAYQDINEASDAPITELLGSFRFAVSALALLRDVVENVGSDEAAARRIAAAFGVTTTELADTMVRETGIGFRSAHEISSRYVRAGNDLSALRTAYQEIAGKPLPFDDSRIHEILEPDHFVEVRKLAGGPSIEGMQAVFKALEAEMDGLRSRHYKIVEQIEAAGSGLERDWKALLS